MKKGGIRNVKNKGERGAVTLFVVVVCVFVMIMLVNEQDMEEIYSRVINE